MESKGYLIDSNVVIDYLSNKLPASGRSFMDNLVDTRPTISVITKIEVLGYNTPTKDNEVLISFIHDAIVLDLTGKVVDRSIELRKASKIKLPDAIIAATAIAFDLTLITGNTRDFKNIPNLKLVNSHKL